MTNQNSKGNKQLNNPRYLAGIVLKEISQNNGYSDLTLNKFLNKTTLSDKDKALATRIVYGVLQWQGLIDFYLGKLSKRSLELLSENILILLRIGLYQILFLDRVPDRAAVYETVKAARMMKEDKGTGLINGILRNFIRQREKIKLPGKENIVEHISVKYSHPSWMVELWLKEFGQEKTMEICQANNEIPYPFIRTNTLVTHREKLIEELSDYLSCEKGEYPEEAVKVNSLSGTMELPLFKKGHFYIQDINSMLVSHLALPKPGEKVVDLCSAPGGKTTHMAQMMGNQGTILAIDLYNHRLKMLEENCARLGIRIVNPVKGDAREILKEYNCVGDKANEGDFDLSLLDAPCSALGVLRKQPELKWRLTMDEIDSMVKLQKELFQSALKAVKPGGKVIYSTCTLTRKENQELVKEMVDEFPSLKVTSPRDILPDKIIQTADYIDETGILFLPSITGGDGFFMTCLRKLPN